MTRSLYMAWCLVLAGSAAAVVPVGRAALRGRSQAGNARERLATASNQASELAALRAVTPRDRKPGSGLASRVSAALARCGLPPSALSSLSPESAFGEGTNRRQRAVLTLGAATLPQVGSFLNAWRRSEPDWIVSSIELSPQMGGPVTPGGDLPLRTVIGIEAVYVEKGSPGGTR